MSAKRKSFEVTRNGKTLTVFPWVKKSTGKQGWRFGWRKNEASEWKYVTRFTKQAAEDAAWKILGEVDAGGLIWSSLDGETRRFMESVHRLARAEDFPAVLAFLESRRKSSEIVASVARYMDHIVAEAGHDSRHLGNVRREVERVARDFAGRSFVDVQPADLLTWFQSRVTRRDGEGHPIMEDGKPKLLADKTRNEIRSYLVGLWNWAVKDGIHPATVTAAQKLPRVKDVARERDIIILTPRGFYALAEEIKPKFRGWLVLCALCGMRPEEVSPVQDAAKTRRDKRGILLEEIDWRFKMIRVPKEVSKVKTVRNIPLSETALAWLKWAGIEEGQTGPVCLENPTEAEETKRLGKVVFKTGWPQDVLRHSYASYRNAELHNLPKVAEEMGTSVRMLNQDYHNPRAEEEALEWWAMRPDGFRLVPMESTSSSDLEELPLVVGL